MGGTHYVQMWPARQTVHYHRAICTVHITASITCKYLTASSVYVQCTATNTHTCTVQVYHRLRHWAIPIYVHISIQIQLAVSMHTHIPHIHVRFVPPTHACLARYFRTSRKQKTIKIYCKEILYFLSSQQQQFEMEIARRT